MQHALQGSPLQKAADDRRKKDPDARRIDPGERIRSAALARVDEDGRSKLIEESVERRHELAGGEQKEEHEDERRPGPQRFADADRLFLSDRHLVFRWRAAALLMAKRDHDRHQQRTDAADDDGQFTADKICDGHLRQDKRQRGNQRDPKHAFERLHPAAGEDDHQKRREDHQRRQLQRFRKRQRRIVQTDQIGQGHRRNADRTKRGRRTVGHQTHQTGQQRRKAHSRQHPGRDRDRRTKTGHTFHKTAKAPADQQHQEALVSRYAGDHLLDDLHLSGMQRQIVQEHRCDDDQDDRPCGHRKSFQRRTRRIEQRQLPHRDCQDGSQHHRHKARLVAGHLKTAQGDDHPQDRTQPQQEHSKLHSFPLLFSCTIIRKTPGKVQRFFLSFQAFSIFFPRCAPLLQNNGKQSASAMEDPSVCECKARHGHNKRAVRERARVSALRCSFR